MQLAIRSTDSHLHVANVLQIKDCVGAVTTANRINPPRGIRVSLKNAGRDRHGAARPSCHLTVTLANGSLWNINETASDMPAAIHQAFAELDHRTRISHQASQA